MLKIEVNFVGIPQTLTPVIFNRVEFRSTVNSKIPWFLFLFLFLFFGLGKT